jgi:hypothetical protein
MSEMIGPFVAGALLGGVAGFGWAQYLYEKILRNYQGYCASYREMLDRRS